MVLTLDGIWPASSVPVCTHFSACCAQNGRSRGGSTMQRLEADRCAHEKPQWVDVVGTRRRTPHRTPVQTRGHGAAVVPGRELTDHGPCVNEVTDPHRRLHRLIAG